MDQKLKYTESKVDQYYRLLFEEVHHQDMLGMFTSELKQITERTALDGNVELIHKEQERYLEFILSIARKPPGTNIQLIFNGKLIKVVVILVAKRSNLEFDYYLSYLNDVSQRGIDTVYLLSIDAENSTLSEQIAYHLHKASEFRFHWRRDLKKCPKFNYKQRKIIRLAREPDLETIKQKSTVEKCLRNESEELENEYQGSMNQYSWCRYGQSISKLYKIKKKERLPT